MPSPVSMSTSRRSPSSAGSISSGDRTCRIDELRTGRRELADDLVGSRVEQVRDQDDDAASVELRAGMTSRRDDVGGAVGRLDRRQVGQQPEDAPRAAHRRPSPRDPAGQRADRDAILAGEPDVAERRRRPLREQELGRGAAGHRGRGIDEQRDRDVLFLDEELDEQLLEAGVDVPVELAQVVAERVVAVVGELDRLAALDAPAAALEPAADGRAHQQEQALELAQERLVEDRRVDLAREERLAGAGNRPVGDGPLGGRRASGRGGAVHRLGRRGGRGATRRPGRRPRRGWRG